MVRRVSGEEREQLTFQEFTAMNISKIRLTAVVMGVFAFGSGVPAHAAASVPSYDHIVMVIEENASCERVVGNSSMPYFNNTLIAGGALMTNSHAVGHPSLPNYLALLLGTTEGISDDVCPIPGAPFAPSLGGQLLAHGVSWESYAESLPSEGSTNCYSPYPYDHDHSPYSSFGDDPASTQLPFQGYWPTDFTQLPRVSVVTPNLLDDMHDGTPAAADQRLQSNIGPYAAWAKAHNSLLIVTYDEDEGGSDKIATVFYGGHVIPGQYSENINHYNVTRTILDSVGVPAFANFASAAPITDIFTPSNTNSAATPTLTASPRR